MVSFLDSDEFIRWMSNAKSTLRSATNDKEAGFYSWACFKAQQSAEFSAKAFLRGIGNDSFGHSVSLLLKKGSFQEQLVNLAKTVDKYYILIRDTDAWPEGTPEDYYTLENANEAIMCSELIIKGVNEKWKLLNVD